MIRRFCFALTLVAWAFWLGGLGMLFVAVTALFRSSRDLGREAAPVVFVAFERYQLVVAGVLLIALVVWRATGRAAGWAGLFAATVLALGAAVAMTAVVSPRLEQLRSSGQSQSPEFKKLHGVSAATYSGQVVLLLIGGVQLLMRGRSQRDDVGLHSEIHPATS